jgi:membrane fusion protein (multidrug efflux system)
MSKRNIYLSAAVIVIVAAVWYFMPGKQAANQKGGGFPPSVVSATEVAQENWLPSLSSVGSLVAVNGISVSTEVSGIVSEIIFESGTAVNKDQILIKLDDSVDLAALEALRAERKLTEIQFNRAKDLYGKKVTSKSEFDETEARFDAAKARVKQQEAIVKRKVIRAPFDGLAGIRQVDLGQYIEAGNPIVSLQSLDPIYVDYTLPERYLNQIKPGEVVNVRLDAVPDKVFTGNVSAVNSGVDTGTRTLKVRATLANPDRLLRPGMFAQVQTITGEAQPVLTLPRTAISFNTYGNFIFVINKSDDGKLSVKRTAVETGETREGRVVVKGLSAGTQAVRTGLVKLRDGAPVTIDNKVELKDAEIKGE